ncbi:unnamed protein product [Sphenostylis stenocarpa]|uniref:Uncharacterized protein n=1 Tax=Sphenostylis stenocarpa TaxID=92480 RepID=A0AA86V3N0_9FABA|nr:unnamed protein product [Sphenostylis stenocarpa]
MDQMKFLEVILAMLLVELLGDETGKWLIGFTQHISHETALLAELGCFMGNHARNKIIDSD